MRKLLVVALATIAVVGLVGSASAGTGTRINWAGQGSDNLPCADGGHWVLTGKGITSAKAKIGGVRYTMRQSGRGSFSVDSIGPISAGTTAYAKYQGTVAHGNPQFVLSHCNDGDGGYVDPY